MGIRLGNFQENKSIKEMSKNISRDIRLATIKEMISKMDNHIQMACDIYDTYYYIKVTDSNFADKLWKLLVTNRIENININSYWAWSIGYNSYVLLSEYGVGVYNQSIRNSLMEYYSLEENDLYRGKALLSDYINDFSVTDEILDKIIGELTILLVNFEKYANDFFQSVSSYRIVKLNSNKIK